MTIIDEKLLSQYRGLGRCEWCKAPCRRQPEHVYPRALGSSRRVDLAINIVGLCAACHQKAHAGHGEPSKQQLKEYVAKRERTTPEAIQELLWAIWRLPQGSQVPSLRRVESGLDASKNEPVF